MKTVTKQYLQCISMCATCIRRDEKEIPQNDNSGYHWVVGIIDTLDLL